MMVFIIFGVLCSSFLDVEKYIWDETFDFYGSVVNKIDDISKMFD